MSVAEAEKQQPLAVARTNTKQGSIVEAMVNLEEELMLFDPLNECIYVVPKEKSRAVLQEANHMQSLAERLSKAREAVLDNEAKLANLNASRFPSIGEVNAVKEALRKAQADYKKARDEVKEQLGKDGYLSTGGKDVMELLPLAKRGASGKPKEWGRKWTYVRSDKMKDHWRKIALGTDSSAHKNNIQKQSFIKNGKIDTKELSNQFTKLDPKIKREWMEGANDAGYLFPKLQAWAEQLNAKASEAQPVRFGQELHLLRYFAGYGGTMEWSPRSGKLAGKFNAKAEVNLAYGECKLEGFAPSETGWALMMTGIKSKNTFHIGAVRLKGVAILSAGAGASAAAELGLEIDYSDVRGKPKVKGAERKKTTPAEESTVNLNKVGVEAGGGAELFAGVKAGGELQGALEYLNPEAKDKFEAIAKIGPKVEVQWGVGAAAALIITYDKGKFRAKLKAGVCFGPGAKGELGVEVDANQIESFMQWFFHALKNASFEFLEVVMKTAYDAATQLGVMLVHGVSGAYRDVQSKWDEFQDDIAREDQRVKLMNRVLSNPRELHYCTPEAHGILLWQLSRHGELTKTTHLVANSDWNEVLGKRKRAILQVCRWAQCRSQFENMVQHMGVNGEKGSFTANYQHLLNFMEIGPANSTLDDELKSIYARLPAEPARGYAVLENNTSAFMAQAHMGNSPTYLAQAQGLFSVAGTARA